MKLNQLLGLLAQRQKEYALAIRNVTKHFTKSGGMFLGQKKTYTPHENYIDEPSKRGLKKVQSTVTEHLNYFIENNKDTISLEMNREATNANANGNQRIDLIVGDMTFGSFSALELMCLKGIVENQELNNMVNSYPVRSDSKIWVECTDPEYEGREIFETPVMEYKNNTTVKEEYILQDPNIVAAGKVPNYTPKTSIRNTLVTMGEGTTQDFSGETTQLHKAQTLKRLSDLRAAITVALKALNETEVAASELDSEELLKYIFFGG